MVSGVIKVQPIWTALGAERAKALPAFHAFTGADNTDRFSQIGKATWLQVCLKTSKDVINALQMLADAFRCHWSYVNISYICKCCILTKGHPNREHLWAADGIFSVSTCLKVTSFPLLSVLSSSIFWKPTSRPEYGVRQAKPGKSSWIYCKMVFYKDKDSRMKPITSEVLPAPEAIIEMIRCQCKTDCSCRSNDLTCTDLC